MKKRVLVIGCGGTGNEIIKLLNLDNKYEITCMDLDIIETSNLARQFYFSDSDRGKFKSETISEKIKCKFLNMRFEESEDGILDFYNIVFSCVDNIATRMEINFQFKNSNCPLLIDLGVDGLKFHVKKVTQASSCLYCIHSLYRMPVELHFCSLSNLDQKITEENRGKMLLSFIQKSREEKLKIGEKTEDKLKIEENLKIEEKTEDKLIIEEIVEDFNSKAPEDLKTTIFEVDGLFQNLIPNVCTINSICAAFAIKIIDSKHDFIFGNFEDGIFINQQIVEKDENCFCNKNK